MSKRYVLSGGGLLSVPIAFCFAGALCFAGASCSAGRGTGTELHDLSTTPTMTSSTDFAGAPPPDLPLVGQSTDLSVPSSFNFDGGWHPQDSGTTAPMVGTGGTTVVLGPGADSTSAAKFAGSSSGSAPSIVYPANGIVVPPNMNALEFHFVPAAGQTLFRLTFKASTTNLVVYTTCTAVGGGCVYATDPMFWSMLAAYARGTAPVTYTISGVNGASPGAVGTSSAQSISFSDQDITGGVYYWNTGGAIERYDFGYPTVPPTDYMTPAKAGAFFCVGCHALSRDGAKIAVGKDIPAPAPYTVFDVATTSALAPAGTALGGTSNFSSFSPDGNLLLISNGATIGLQELYTGSILDATVVPSGTMPDWAPDGEHMVYAQPATAAPFGIGTPGIDSGSIESLHFNGKTWDTPSTLVPFDGANNYYPAYAPTGDYVVYNRSPQNANSFDNAAPEDGGAKPDGELWVVSTAGGTPVRLDNASNGGNCQWPKWAPVVNDYNGGKMLWLTFSSDRAYGLRLKTGDQTQLWMVGFDLTKAAKGEDPSLPGFWLPFQNIGSGNHIAQWATTVVRPPCTSDAMCAAQEICTNGRCVPNIIN